MLLTVYLTYEYTKDKDSFYYPYLNILPDPGNISEWSREDLLFLQVSKSLSNVNANIPSHLISLQIIGPVTHCESQKQKKFNQCEGIFSVVLFE